MEFVSAEFSACLLSSSFGYGSDVSEAVSGGCPHLALSSVIEATSDPQIVADSSGLGCTQDGPNCSAKLSFISTEPRGVSVNNLSHCRICFCLSLPSGLLSILD